MKIRRLLSIEKCDHNIPRRVRTQELFGCGQGNGNRSRIIIGTERADEAIVMCTDKDRFIAMDCPRKRGASEEGRDYTG